MPSPSAPVSRKAKHSPEDVSLHRELSDAFYAKGDKWVKGAAEATQLYRVIDWAHKQAPDAPADFARAVVDMFWRLKSGVAPGQAVRDRDFWAKQPFTPCGLVGLTTRVSQYLRANTEAARQLEAFK